MKLFSDLERAMRPIRRIAARDVESHSLTIRHSVQRVLGYATFCADGAVEGKRRFVVVVAIPAHPLSSRQWELSIARGLCREEFRH